ncbi:MAG: RrF2 family transcriptional regulator [Armatimonadota bacterium]
MMQVPQKTRYALRAMFELAKHYGEGPVRISDIAQRQSIPSRFLEGILNQLRQAGLLRSVRGARGGYEMVNDPATVSVGDMIRIIEGPIAPTACVADDNPEDCPLFGDCVFLPMWKQLAEAVTAVYDGTTFGDFVKSEQERAAEGLTYCI